VHGLRRGADARTIALPAELMVEPTPRRRVRRTIPWPRRRRARSGAAPTEFRTPPSRRPRETYSPARNEVDASAAGSSAFSGDRGLVVYALRIGRQVDRQRHLARELSTPGETVEARGRAGPISRHAAITRKCSRTRTLRPLRARRRRQRSVARTATRRGQSHVQRDRTGQEGNRTSGGPSARMCSCDRSFKTRCSPPSVRCGSRRWYPPASRRVRRLRRPMRSLSTLTATLVDSGALRFLHKSTSRSTRCSRRMRGPERTAQIADSSVVEDSFAAASEAIEKPVTHVIQALRALDRAGGAAKSTLGRMQHRPGGLHAKMIQAAKRRDDTLRGNTPYTRARVPDGHAQERMIGFSPSSINTSGAHRTPGRRAPARSGATLDVAI